MVWLLDMYSHCTVFNKMNYRFTFVCSTSRPPYTVQPGSRTSRGSWIAVTQNSYMGTEVQCLVSEQMHQTNLITHNKKNCQKLFFSCSTWGNILLVFVFFWSIPEKKESALEWLHCINTVVTCFILCPGFSKYWLTVLTASIMKSTTVNWTFCHTHSAINLTFSFTCGFLWQLSVF